MAKLEYQLGNIEIHVFFLVVVKVKQLTITQF